MTRKLSIFFSPSRSSCPLSESTISCAAQTKPEREPGVPFSSHSGSDSFMHPASSPPNISQTSVIVTIFLSIPRHHNVFPGLVLPSCLPELQPRAPRQSSGLPLLRLSYPFPHRFQTELPVARSRPHHFLLQLPGGFRLRLNVNF